MGPTSQSCLFFSVWALVLLLWCFLLITDKPYTYRPLYFPGQSSCPASVLADFHVWLAGEDLSVISDKLSEIHCLKSYLEEHLPRSLTLTWGHCLRIFSLTHRNMFQGEFIFISFTQNCLLANGGEKNTFPVFFYLFKKSFLINL